MNIQTEKLVLIEWISKLNDVSVIRKLREFQESHPYSADWWDNLDKEEKASIERGLKDIEEGRIHTNESAQKLYGKYL